MKTQNVIDAKEMEAASNTADALSPPIEVAVTHYVPVKKWDAPVLSPLLGELVVLEMGFGRRAAAPIMRKFIRSRENIGAVIINAERNVAHQGKATLFGIRLNPGPLFVRNPLNVAKGIFAIVKLFFLFRGLSLQPGARGIDALMFSRPFVPRFALTIFFHQRAKKRIVVEPG